MTALTPAEFADKLRQDAYLALAEAGNTPDQIQGHLEVLGPTLELARDLYASLLGERNHLANRAATAAEEADKSRQWDARAVLLAASRHWMTRSQAASDVAGRARLRVASHVAEETALSDGYQAAIVAAVHNGAATAWNTHQKKNGGRP